MIYIKFFGDWKVYSNGKEMKEFKSRKALKIFFYLLLTGRTRVSVNELFRTFWAGYSLDYAKKNLNTQLYYLRNDLKIPKEYLSGEREFVYIAQDYFQSDYKEFLEAIESVDLEKAKQIFSGPLLEGISDEWVKKYRVNCQRMFDELLFTYESNLISERNKFIRLKSILEHQMVTRERYFIPLLIRTEKNVTFSVRKGDFC